jgi:hypothetical protein
VYVKAFAESCEDNWNEANREKLAALIKAMPMWKSHDMEDDAERIEADLTATSDDNDDAAAQDALDAVCDYADAAGVALT